MSYCYEEWDTVDIDSCQGVTSIESVHEDYIEDEEKEQSEWNEEDAEDSYYHSIRMSRIARASYEDQHDLYCICRSDFL